MVNTYLGREAIERETDKAYLVRVPNGVTGFHDRKVWLPKSKCEWHAEGCFAETLFVPEWLARKI